MVTTTAAQRVMLNLQVVESTLAELPEIAAEWDELAATVEGRAEQAAWALEWEHMMLDRLAELAAYASAGLMTEEQSEQYDRLLLRLTDAVPILRRHGLCLPPVRLPDQRYSR